MHIPQSPEKQRIYYLDAMRSILMMGGVLLHSAQVFNPDQAWLISNSVTSPFAYLIVEFIRIFRMESFFVVSGFFMLLTFQKYGISQFLRIRLIRIFVPLVATAVTLNSLQTYILSRAGWYNFSLPNYLLEGAYISHLWFLLNLVVYFIFFSAISLVVLKRRDQLKMVLLRLPLVVWPVFFSLFPYVIIVLGKMGVPIYEDVLGVVEIYTLLEYVPYFLMGYLLAFDRSLLTKFSNFPIWAIILAIVFSNFGLYLIAGDAEGRFSAFFYLFKEFQAWSLVLLCFKVFFVFANVQSNSFKYLSDASYTVYLFHHLCVVVLGLGLLHADVHPLLGFVFIVLVTILVTLLIHTVFVSRIPVFRFLFNGKR